MKRQDAQWASKLRPFLHRLAKRDVKLDRNLTFRRLLKDAGDDPIMQEVQDAFFDRVYWEPSVKSAGRFGLTGALESTVVYDSHIHGSWKRIRKRTTARHGAAKTIGSKSWIRHYIAERHDWLANHSNTLLHRTVYRMETFRDLVRQKKWTLCLPFRVRGIRLDKNVLMHPTPIRVSAEDPDERILRRQRPLMRGSDIKAVQRALKKAGMNIKIDGEFGVKTEKAVKKFQQRLGLKVDGIVGPATLAALGL